MAIKLTYASTKKPVAVSNGSGNEHFVETSEEKRFKRAKSKALEGKKKSRIIDAHKGFYGEGRKDMHNPDWSVNERNQ